MKKDDIYLKKGNNKLSFPTGSHQTTAWIDGKCFKQLEGREGTLGQLAEDGTGTSGRQTVTNAWPLKAAAAIVFCYSGKEKFSHTKL